MITLGSKSMSGLYLGSKTVNKVYLGNAVVWEPESSDNLFDVSKAERGSIAARDGSDLSSTTSVRTHYIAVKKNSIYQIKVISTNIVRFVVYYSKSGGLFGTTRFDPVVDYGSKENYGINFTEESPIPSECKFRTPAEDCIVRIVFARRAGGGCLPSQFSQSEIYKL